MRVLIAGSQFKLRFALRVALERQPGFTTMAEASDAQDVIDLVQGISPDLTIVAWGLPGIPPAQLISILRGRCPSARVIVLDSREETRPLALAAGADAFVCMCDSPDELLSAIEPYFAGNANPE